VRELLSSVLLKRYFIVLHGGDNVMNPILITLLVTAPIILVGTLLYLSRRAFSPKMRIGLKWGFFIFILLGIPASFFIWSPHGAVSQFIAGLLFIFGFTVIPLAMLVCSAIWSRSLTAILVWGVLSVVLMVLASTFLYIVEGIASAMAPGHAQWLFKTTVIIFSASLIIYFWRTLGRAKKARRTA
jgi:hypothetical protein